MTTNEMQENWKLLGFKYKEGFCSVIDPCERVLESDLMVWFGISFGKETDRKNSNLEIQRSAELGR